MNVVGASTSRTTPERARRAPAFAVVFLGAVLAGLAGLAGAHVLLDRAGLLPAPPLAATFCIDDKFAFFREQPSEDRTLLAVGSSATWRNLEMPVFERRFPGTRALNAGPCYLHIDQAAHYAEFLLARMPRVATVVAVLAPRDFEACPPEETAFFDPGLAGAYLSGWVPRWLPYLTGFRPLYLAREGWRRLQERRTGGPPPAHEDGLGSYVARHRIDWRPPLRIDPRCYAGLAALEEAAAARGARLVLATLPTMPEWAAANDPTGAAIEEWTRSIAATLRRETSLLVDGRPLGWGDDRFADPVHLLYPHHRAFTEFIADAIERAGCAIPGATAPSTGPGGNPAPCPIHRGGGP
jgi:hypothetical protein